MKLFYSVGLLGSFVIADSRIRLEHGHYGRLLHYGKRPDSSEAAWATVCSLKESPITKKFASDVCLNINSELESYFWQNTTNPYAVGYPSEQVKDLTCKEEGNFSTCVHDFKVSNCIEHSNDVVINCKKPTIFDKSVEWSEWSAWNSDRFYFKWRSRNCTSKLRSVDVDIVSCSLKYPGKNWFYGEICQEEACSEDDRRHLAFDDSDTDIIPDAVIKLIENAADDEDLNSESSGDRGLGTDKTKSGTKRKGSESSGRNLIFSPLILMLLLLIYLLI